MWTESDLVLRINRKKRHDTKWKKTNKNQHSSRKKNVNVKNKKKASRCYAVMNKAPKHETRKKYAERKQRGQ